SEGTRAPRNGYELAAQGYMVGNCAHCHSPRGFPSVTNSVLKEILNFLPGPNGGVFQFPLERYSPRIGRGPGGGELIPYITPSLMDLPSAYWNSTDALLKDNWFYKLANGIPGDSVTAPVYQYLLYAPWRSLIYRNVDTPFAYETNLALFPHMPMNTPGYDCRAKQVMGDWMVSIPSIRKNPEIPEYAFAAAPGLQNIVGGSTVDDNPQPYVEVLPGSPLYAEARRAADSRLEILRTGVNPNVPASQTDNVYAYCPDTSDIVDPAVTVDPVCHAVPTNLSGSNLGRVAEVTPARPHWVNTDLTQAPQAPGKFSVRRADWQEVLLQQKFQPPAQHCSTSLDQATAAQNEVKLAVRLLQDVSLDDAFRSYATSEVPFGLWQQKAACHFSSVPTAGSFVADKRPLWMGQVDGIAPTDPVYMASPGVAVFGMICVNCHGPNADAHGRLSDNLATMTGGNAIVANFKDGFFGPVDSPGLHRQEAFATSLLPAGVAAGWTNATADDRAARYLAFMALGGTEVQIPASILTVVGDTRILGVKRVLPPSAISANMLSAAKAICASLLSNSTGASYMSFDWTRGWFDLDKPGHLKNFGYLIPANGDAELWLRLCSMNNPPPVRVIRAFSGDPPWASIANGDSFDLIDPGAYGQVSAGNQNGKVDATLTASNLLPWCVATDPPGAKNYSAEQAFATVNSFPVCPVTLPCATSAPDGGPATCWSADRMDQWATRGAINAGLAVYTYVDGLVRDLSQGKAPKPTYDQCDKLP
ncbi:MAG: hypothetical protein M3O46_00490, partial [Myxococcota bacterium]|nr:hypothetical protein [Myxococcota bacterium]